MTLSACPCRVHSLDIPSYYIFCPISSSVTLMVKTLKLLCLSCQLLIHCVSSPSLPVLWQLRWTYNYFSFVSGHTRGERGFSSWFHCAFPGGPCSTCSFCSALIQQHTWFLQEQVPTALSNKKHTAPRQGKLPLERSACPAPRGGQLHSLSEFPLQWGTAHPLHKIWISDLKGGKRGLLELG